MTRNEPGSRQHGLCIFTETIFEHIYIFAIGVWLWSLDTPLSTPTSTPTEHAIITRAPRDALRCLRS